MEKKGKERNEIEWNEKERRGEKRKRKERNEMR